MTPEHFTEATHSFGPPEGMAESQVQTVHAWVGQALGGSCDGSTVVVVAWKPTPEELAEMLNGSPLFLTFLGSLPPHYPSTSFEQAVHPR